MNKTGVIVINLNTYGYTRKCIEDLLKQNVPFDLTLVDQASQEAGIREFFESIRSSWDNRGKLTIKYNSINEPLNEVWNTFAEESDNEYLHSLTLVNHTQTIYKRGYNALRLYQKRS